jgi:hypothetical protein
VEAAHEISWRPLGELFVESRLLTRERLEHALAEQATRGGRLGDKLVELGYVTRHDLARVLAEQTGIELDVDSGFGTGLLAELRRRTNAPALAAPDDYTEPTLVQTRDQEPNLGVMSTYAALEEMWARLAAAESRITELEHELRTIPRHS